MLHVYMSHINILWGSKMKTKFKLALTLLIIGLILLPSNLQAKNTIQVENKEEPTCIGHIEGRVGNSHGLYYWEPYLFALVDAEVKQTRTSVIGWYHLFLPLNQKYNITAYKSGFKPMTKEVNLTTDSPHRELNFDFFESEPDDSYNLKRPAMNLLFYLFIFKYFGGGI